MSHLQIIEFPFDCLTSFSSHLHITIKQSTESLEDPNTHLNTEESGVEFTNIPVQQWTKHPTTIKW
jgi:hypothetical protein